MATPSAYTQRPDELICTLIRAGWSQEQIAEATEVSQPTICRIYSGRHKDPRYSVVEKLRQLVLNLNDFQRVAR
ncbi:helix-turn-helix domain-containing protein [Ralstonia syzygii]|uniref:helix-turn-helix domain-containing protein n=1 Tax=Ralstonia syzygii TaxID=28097 RepID=UPI0018D045CF|nr:helix-turn-helix domain-containing protein [Ralstonia syzygii]